MLAPRLPVAAPRSSATLDLRLIPLAVSDRASSLMNRASRNPSSTGKLLLQQKSYGFRSMNLDVHMLLALAAYFSLDQKQAKPAWPKSMLQ